METAEKRLQQITIVIDEYGGTARLIMLAGLVLHALGRTAAVGDEVEINVPLRVAKVDCFRFATLSLFFPASKAETLPSGQAD